MGGAEGLLLLVAGTKPTRRMLSRTTANQSTKPHGKQVHKAPRSLFPNLEKFHVHATMAEFYPQQPSTYSGSSFTSRPRRGPGRHHSAAPLGAAPKKRHGSTHTHSLLTLTERAAARDAEFFTPPSPPYNLKQSTTLSSKQPASNCLVSSIGRA